MIHTLSCALLLAQLAPGETDSHLSTDPLPVEVVIDLRSVTDVAISPDGSQVAYAVSVPRTDGKPGPRQTEVWVTEFDRDDHRLYIPATSEASAVEFTPDGESLSFLRKDGDQTQVWRMPLEGGEATPVTHAPRSISAYRFSPGGDLVAYSMRDGDTDEQKAAKESGRDFTVVGESHSYTRLYIEDLKSGESRRVSDGDLQVWSFEWTHDGAKLICKVSDTPLTDHQYMYTRIGSFDATGGPATTLFGTAGKLGTPVTSRDGRQVAWAGASDLHDPYAGSLFVGDTGTGSTRNLTGDFEATTSSVQFLDDGRLATVTYERQRTVLRTLGIDGVQQSSTIQWGGPEAIRHVTVDRTATRFAAIASTATHPPELYTGTLDRDGAPRRRTWHNAALQGYALGKQEIFQWTARDGLSVEGVLVKPVGYRPGGEYPLVLNVHGGPEGVVSDGWNTSYGYWSQLLATRGYMVLLPNYRASIGRGVAYSKLDHRDLGGMEFTDLIDAVDALADRGDIDPERVGIGGASYGGYFSMWAATRHSRRFRAAVAFAGISNWVSMLGTSDIPEENLLVHWNLPARGNIQQFMERSPITWVELSETPLLIVHGEKDLRVPIGQSTELHTMMRLMDKPVQFVTYPREPHGIRERAHQIDFVERVLDWFDRYVKPTRAEG